MPAIYVTSDTHYSHKNIIKYCQRPWTHVDDMDADLVKWWNDTVGPSDIIYHLGDVSLNEKVAQRIVPTLNGTKILLKGNHDNFSNASYHHMGFINVIDKPYYILDILGAKVMISHYPQPPKHVQNKGCFINYFGHIHNNPGTEFPFLQGSSLHVNVSVEMTNYKPLKIGHWDHVSFGKIE